MAKVSTKSFRVILSGSESDRLELRGFAMAAAILKVRLAEVNSFMQKRRLRNGKPYFNVEWDLDQHSSDGKYKTAELLLWWNDRQWQRDNPDHPLAILREYWQALQDAAVHEKSVPYTVVLSRGRKHVMIPTNVSESRKKELLTQFNAI